MPITRATALAAALLVSSLSAAQPPLVADGAARTVEVWAKKGMMESPVSICFDPQGNLYIAETDRAGNAVEDTRALSHLHAVEEDLRFKTVEDRRDEIHRWVAQGAFPPDYFTKTEDRIRVLSDTDGDGIADSAKVFAGGFNDEVDGIGAGVLWLNGTLYYTCIPHLWALPDADRDLTADSRQSLAEGFGVRWCFFGHDLHGLTAGPDGRIYFSMGDRGFNVTTQEGEHLVGPDRGGVFRCWPDGSGLELFYQGLRNPQELAFNELGDLFTGDNNCDSGDKARIVHIVEGGDSGWRQDVQSLDSRGPWNREFTWNTLADKSGPERPAWALPPVDYMGDGPSGLALYPGTGESHAYDGCFFLCDFRGSGASVHAFQCVPNGAGFTLADHVVYYDGLTITDIAWGYDGRLYMSDWGGGWSPNPNGVILTVTNKTVHDDPTESAAIAQVQGLFKAGFDKRPANELLGLLGHRDQRVRLAAQYELASRGLAVGELASIAADPNARMVARVHAIWTLGQMARKAPVIASRIARLTADPDPEVRTQAIRTLGDLPGGSEYAHMFPEFEAALRDSSPRVQLAATIFAARHAGSEAVQPLLDLLAAVSTSDLTLRHGASYALSCVADPSDLANYAAAHDLPAAARMGVVLALRRSESERAGDYLTDPDPAVAIESARAIYDLRLTGMTRLAALLGSDIPADRAIEPLLRRAIEANVLLGKPENAARLAGFSMNGGVDTKWRKLALERLLAWDQPLPREGVWGNWVGLPARPAADVERAIRPRMDSILMSAAPYDDLIPLAYRLQARFALNLTSGEMASHVTDDSLPSVQRLAILNQLAAAPEAADALGRLASSLMDDPSAAGPLRWRAMELFAKSAPAAAAEPLRRGALAGPIADRQHAVRVLGSIKTDEAGAALAGLARELGLGWLDRDIALDVYEAAMSLPDDAPAHVSAKPAGIQPPRPAGFATNLLVSGGNAETGRDLFLHNAPSQCIRCHTVEGQATQTAPNLRGVGERLTPELLVQSICEPGAVVAPGFGAVSAMPDMTKLLAPGQVRDIVAYLRTLDGSAAAAGGPRKQADAPARRQSPAPAAPDRAQGNAPVRLLVFILAVVLASVVWRSLTRRV